MTGVEPAIDEFETHYPIHKDFKCLTKPFSGFEPEFIVYKTIVIPLN